MREERRGRRERKREKERERERERGTNQTGYKTERSKQGKVSRLNW